MKRLLLLLACVSFAFGANAQLGITAVNTPTVITFDATLAGVNNGQFAGSGFQPVPGVGELNALAWSVIGMSDGTAAFGATNTSGDHARGASAGGVSTGGTYAFAVGGVGVDHAMGFQAAGSDVTPGEYILRVVNNTDSLVDSLIFGCELWNFNDQARSSVLRVEYRVGQVGPWVSTGIDIISLAAAAATPAWVDSAFVDTLAFPTNLGANDTIEFRFFTDDVSGSGSRDEFAIDDISVTMKANGPAPVSTVAPQLTSLTVVESDSIVLSFNIDVNTTAGATASNYTQVRASNNPGSTWSTTTATVNTNTVGLKLNGPITNGRLDSLRIQNITDLAGTSSALDTTVSFLVNFSNPQVFITEITADDAAGADSTEFIELYNAGSTTAYLGGMSFDQGINYTFVEGDSLAPNSFFVLVQDTLSFAQVLGNTYDAQWASGGLSNSGEDVYIVNTAGDTVVYVDYATGGEWPEEPNHSGSEDRSFSYYFCASPADMAVAPKSINNDGCNWSYSTTFGGIINKGATNDSVFASPGALGAGRCNDGSGIIVNLSGPPCEGDTLAVTIAPKSFGVPRTESDYGYVWNFGAIDTTVTGNDTLRLPLTGSTTIVLDSIIRNACFLNVNNASAGNSLTVAPASSNASIGLGAASVAAGDSLFVEVLNSVAGETFVWNFASGNPSTSTNLTDSVAWPSAGQYAVSLIRTFGPSCTDTLDTTITVTPGPNTSTPDIIITEFLYDDPSGPDTLEFIEFLNRETNPVDVSGFYITQQFSGNPDTLYQFPQGTTIGGNAYFVVATDSAAFRNFFGTAPDDEWPQFGLSNSGEEITLVNSVDDTLAYVEYDNFSGGDPQTWPSEADHFGGANGSWSLQLCDLTATDLNDPCLWSLSTVNSGNEVNGDTVFASPGFAGEGRCSFSIEPQQAACRDSVVDFAIVPRPAADDAAVSNYQYDWVIETETDLDTLFNENDTLNILVDDDAIFIALFQRGECTFESEPFEAPLTAGEPFASADTIDEGQSIDFSIVDGRATNDVDWVFNGGTPGTGTGAGPISVTFADSGTYVIEVVISEGGCFEEFEAEVRVNDVVGLNESSTVRNLIAFPNPSSDVVNLSYSLPQAQQLQVEVLDVNGKVAYRQVTQSAADATLQLDLNGLPAGVYLVSLRPEQGQPATLRIVRR